jgi:hypothetical protein
MAVCAVLFAGLLAGCSNPDGPTSLDTGTQTASTAPRSPGETAAPPPPTAASQAPTRVQHSPQAALGAFAELYINWSYRTLSTDQQSLASVSVGAARLAERQAAAASAGDTAITQGRVFNHGQVVSIAAELSGEGTWVIVTREQTGGSSDYEGLPPAYHVTLAHLATVPGGYAVSEWLPQS